MSVTELPLKTRVLGPMLRRLRPAWLSARIKRLARIPRVVVHTQLGVFEVDSISHFGHRLIQDGVYEPVIERSLRRFLRPGGTFVDLGANEGYFTIIAARVVGPTGRVIAIEPQSRLKAPILRNMQLNNVNNVELIQAAVTDCSGSATLYLTPDLNTGSSGLGQATRYELDCESIRTATLASLLADAAVTNVDFLKMDIEGFEYEAILGSENVFRSGIIKTMTIDWHDELMRRRGLDPNRLESALVSFGYESKTIDGLKIWDRIAPCIPEVRGTIN